MPLCPHYPLARVACPFSVDSGIIIFPLGNTKVSLKSRQAVNACTVCDLAVLQSGQCGWATQTHGERLLTLHPTKPMK